MRRWFNRRVLINKVGLSLPKEMIVSLAPSLMCNRVSGFFSALELSSACATLLSFISPASLCRFASVGAVFPNTQILHGHTNSPGLWLKMSFSRGKGCYPDFRAWLRVFFWFTQSTSVQVLIEFLSKISDVLKNEGSEKKIIKLSVRSPFFCSHAQKMFYSRPHAHTVKIWTNFELDANHHY